MFFLRFDHVHSKEFMAFFNMEKFHIQFSSWVCMIESMCQGHQLTFSCSNLIEVERICAGAPSHYSSFIKCPCSIARQARQTFHQQLTNKSFCTTFSDQFVSLNMNISYASYKEFPSTKKDNDSQAASDRRIQLLEVKMKHPLLKTDK